MKKRLRKKKIKQYFAHITESAKDFAVIHMKMLDLSMRQATAAIEHFNAEAKER